MEGKSQPYKDKRWLRKQYVDKKRSMHSIAKELGISPMTVRKYLIRFGIKIRSAQGKPKKRAPRNKKLANKGWLYKKYVVDGLSLQSVAKLCGCSSKRSVKRALEFHGIKVRDLKQARSNRSKRGHELRARGHERANDLQYVASLYMQGHSINAISRMLHISPLAVIRRLDMANVKRRRPWEHRIGRSHTDETRERMSRTAAEQIVTGKRKIYPSVQHPYVLFPDGSYKQVRSSYEKLYIEYLIKNKIPFEYEPRSFDLGRGISYVPDIYLPETDEYVEIKGYLSSKQNTKYERFRDLYPNVKWRILFKEDLKALGIVLHKFKTIYLVCGVPGSGKSWVCEQLSNKYIYVSYDHVPKKQHIDMMYEAKGPVIHDLPVKVSTFIKRYSCDFNIVPVFIIESEKTIRSRLKKRGGKFTKHIRKRMETMERRAAQYGVFVGTSDEVLRYLSKIAQ